MPTLAITMIGAVWLWASIGSAEAQAARPVRIMPLGDSLTSSVDGQASYRFWLWKRLASARFRVDFVGTQWGVGSGTPGPDGFDRDHEGHPGATTDDLMPYVKDLAQQARPDIVLLLVGGNDLERGFSAAYALSNTVRIIARLRTANPNITILWALQPPEARLNAQIRAYNAGALRLASSRSRPNSPIRIVDLWSNFFPGADTLDGEHPNAMGEHKFANRFFNALTPLVYRYRR